jgi:hypothetical protein
MALMNFDVPATERQHTVTVPDTAPVVSQTVSVVSERRTHLVTESEQWSWSQLRDYVVHEIESRFGAIPGRDPVRESGIFKRFVSARKPDGSGGWGELAGPIAVHAFTQDNGSGFWANAPISTTRFCRNSDPFFASVIADRLTDRT